MERPASAGAATGVAAPILLTLLEVLDVLPTVDTFAYPMLLSLPVAIAALTVDTFAVVFVTRPTRTPLNMELLVVINPGKWPASDC